MDNNLSLAKFSKNHFQITRLTALWALSESMLGGLLHAAHIPFRGMIISSAAVIIISLIAYFSERKGEILKATFVVLLIKAGISPHTPVAAYFAVFLQGTIGEVLFFRKKYFKISAVTFGVIVGILTGSQRVITYTIFFGTTLWEAINEFIKYILKELPLLNTTSFNFSLTLICIYIFIHIVFGIAAGILAAKLPRKLNSESAKSMFISESDLLEHHTEVLNQRKHKKPKWRKYFFNAILLFAVILLIITYINPQAINLEPKSILIMMIRAIVISIVWFYLLSPILLEVIKKLLHKKQNLYTDEIKGIMSHFPFYKSIVSITWKASAKQKGIKRLKYFIIATLVNVLNLKNSD